eukprot:TRINITY_DN11266_c0_g2_i5.p1 TRINITY_DN11266_c0_g2~~TRINITY_DN11266_c0_g2_i5.p1  ORF type:complete len:529 (-),score=75.73 TRINITY_DN11266_c0_g2_i5:81-1667(-)
MEPGGSGFGVAASCLYCHSPLDALWPTPPCGHLICSRCRDNSPSNLVRVVSPHANLVSSSDHKDQPADGNVLCLFCSGVVRTASVTPSLLDLLRCAHCGGVCHHACDGTCGHSMCEACAHYVCRTASVCPTCQQPLQPDDIGPARSLRRRVSDVVYVCKYSVYGCVETGKEEQLKAHEAQCEHGELVCDHCARCVKRSEWHHHLQACVAVQIPCPHQCAARQTRREMEAHVLQCEYGPVVCDLPACGYQTQRRHLAQHQADLALHLNRLSNFHHTLHAQQQAQLHQQQAQLQQQQAQLQQQQVELQQQHDTIRHLQMQLEAQSEPLRIVQQLHNTIQQIQVQQQQLQAQLQAQPRPQQNEKEVEVDSDVAIAELLAADDVPAPPPNPAVPAARAWEAGDYVDVADTVGRWLAAQVEKVRPGEIFVHYLDWDRKWDEWISLEQNPWRIVDFGTYSSGPKTVLYGLRELVEVYAPKPPPARWIQGSIRKVNGGQVLVEYNIDAKQYHHWFHVSTDAIRKVKSNVAPNRAI